MNLIELSNQIEKNYRNYLQTIFYFRNPDLRRSFHQALADGYLRKGPYLEATPTYKKGATPSQLLRECFGRDRNIDSGFLNALQGDRPLYRHQEKAIRSVMNNRNVVVATGTGSGKTEAFLLPILFHLYDQFQKGVLGPGVRALILYPMNALANDQRERLGDICRKLYEKKSPFRFTFGQYTGETPEDVSDSQRHGKDKQQERFDQGFTVIQHEKVIHGELIFRKEMRETPPNILLTNYSMLEYLLLRPDDSPLFDNGRAQWWNFLVLDEAHQYRGTKGVEMAMLLRRLKQRLREGGRQGNFLCIATSATLAGREEDKLTAEFASQLFGESFFPEDVIFGETEQIVASASLQFTIEDYLLMKNAFEGKNPPDVTPLLDLAKKYNIPVAGSNEPAKILGTLLQQDKRATDLRRYITGAPSEVDAVANIVFTDLPKPKQIEALSDLVSLLVRAEDPTTGSRLLSARYHVFLRALEGAFLYFDKEQKVSLNRHAATNQKEENPPFFEVALCRNCGQHYIVGLIRNDKLEEAIRDPSHEEFGAHFFLPTDGEPSEEEDETADSKTDRALAEYYLCTRCAKIRRSDQKRQCTHDSEIRVLRQKESSTREDEMFRCMVCGYQAQDPVREVTGGTDAPHTVIATTILEDLPNDRRKVLAFADGRQDAAFFAWYFENTYKDILARKIILNCLKLHSSDYPEGFSLRDIAIGLPDIFSANRVLPPAASKHALDREAWRLLYRELLTEEERLSLEGVGLVSWTVELPKWFKLPHVLTEAPWSLSTQEARDLLLLLLNTVRADRAVEIRMPKGVPLKWEDLDLQSNQYQISATETGNMEKNERRWAAREGAARGGKRVHFLARVYQRIHPESSEETARKAAINLLRSLWDEFHEYETGVPKPDRLLIPAENNGRLLNPDWCRLRYINRSDSTYQCDTCGRIQPISVKEVCSRYRCPGTLRRIQRGDLPPNYYRDLYETQTTEFFRIEEHTAQITPRKAQEFQEDFRKGNIQILSCSTTFELGVDLGDLDIVFLRNVPPESFNYAQRVGRAGRRSGYPGFAVTYCKRTPHDLYHFAQPDRMLSGKTRPPVLSLCNQKIILRHITAVALSLFFKEYPERFKNVEKLLGTLHEPAFLTDFRNFLKGKQSYIEKTLRRIVPNDTAQALGFGDGTGNDVPSPATPSVERQRELTAGSWIDQIAGNDSRLASAELEVRSDYLELQKIEHRAIERNKNNRDYDLAKWAQRRCRTIAHEDVISFLSRKAVIPKYGFPVDVVELDIQPMQDDHEVKEVVFERDLSIAIAEFAPTSRLVANKKEWTSYGLKRIPEKEWPQRCYARCSTHGAFAISNKDEDLKMPCGCRTLGKHRTYYIPQFGFITEKGKPTEPKQRPRRFFSTRPYFVQLEHRHVERLTLPDDKPVVSITKAAPGLMVVLCESKKGEGFYVCQGCGAGFLGAKKTHKTPQGQDCKSTLRNVSLGHEFITDVVQLQFFEKPPNPINGIAFTLSLAYAIAEGAAEVLEVPSTELGTTVTYGNHLVLPIILYDTCPGGAGLVARLEQPDVLRQCFEIAHKRVSGNCGCDANSSCYGCLRNYRNQFSHHELVRGPVYEYLDNILKNYF